MVQPRRNGTLAVGIAAALAAVVLSACEPAGVSEALMVMIPSASAAEVGRMQAGVAPARVAAGPVFGEISSIEPIRQQDKTPTAAVTVSGKEKLRGYRIHVRLDNGGSRSFERSVLNGLDVGSRVRIDDGELQQV